MPEGADTLTVGPRFCQSPPVDSQLPVWHASPNRPHSPIQAGGKMALEAAGGKTMFAFWKPLLTDILIDAVKADDGTLVHLATEEFEHLFDWKRILKELHVVQPHFYVQKGDQLKNVTVYAKSCRGAMTRFILQNGIERPEDLLAFEYEGFSVSPHSTIPPDSKAGLTELLWTLEA